MSFNEGYNKSELLAIIESEKFKEIFIKNNIFNVLIFGSLYTEEFNEESDVDIAVIAQNKIPFKTEINITLELEKLLGRDVDFIDINDENINNIIKIEALNSKKIIINDELLNNAIEKYDRLYKENREFWDILDREVLGNE
ncbi:Predicted nucleotidyltransferase [Clostridium collagenovorans DSM 3089]|uniref:Predicted nucleotidyltransferase n=1 Tax=Clostridium collagenovorans DSM 3089 TaxID=1121306 RepID=A0A1M5VDD7_9CLOT|nr:nucleotidyltransferase domain-containing protein [Clostridium collagenovorans]SHH73240.1 Predicted nucleotidyltransferase [Clostridium collagenovorans DSM 3089]